MGESFPVENPTAEDIPAGGLAEWTGVNTDTGAYLLAKPTASDNPNVMVVGQFGIPAAVTDQYGTRNGKGTASFAARTMVAIDETAGVPGIGESLGSVAGSWYAAAGGSGFICLFSSSPWVSCIRSSVAPAPVTAWKATAAHVVSTTALPANVYDNGADGIGATLTATANGALASIDGVFPFSGGTPPFTVLVNGESDKTHNGVYELTQIGDATHPYVLTRRADCDHEEEIVSCAIPVMLGTHNKDTVWLCDSDPPLDVGISWLTWICFRASPLTTKGDVYTYSTVDARLGVGSNNQVLVADSTAATGLKWYTPGSPTTNYVPYWTGSAYFLGSTSFQFTGAGGFPTVWTGNSDAAVSIRPANNLTSPASAYLSIFDSAIFALRIGVLGFKLGNTFPDGDFALVANSDANWSTGTYVTMTMDDPSNPGAGITVRADWNLYHDTSVSPPVYRSVFDAASGNHFDGMVRAATYVAKIASADRIGVTGDDTIGNRFAGGICYAVGTGSGGTIDGGSW